MTVSYPPEHGATDPPGNDETVLVLLKRSGGEETP